MSEVTARLVAIVGALLAVAMTARIGGAVAAALLATTPAFVLLGRNVQPDGWAIALSLAAYAAWRGDRRSLSGLLFGLALFTKPTMLILPAALAVDATIARRGPGWLDRAHVAWAALALAPNLLWTGLQLVLHRDAYLAGLRHGGGAFEMPDVALAGRLAGEVAFAFFPVLAIAAPLAASRPSALRGPALWVLAAGLTSFAFVHYHGYYLVAYAPAAAVLAGAHLAKRRTLLLALLVINAFATQLVVGGHGLGRTALHEIASQRRGDRFLMSPDAWAGYWTLVELYGAPAAIVTDACVDADAATGAVVLPAPPGTMADVIGVDRPHGMAFGSFVLAELPLNPHGLTWGRLRWRRRDGDRSIGLVDAGAPIAIGALAVPVGARACPATTPP